jgi:hypothetical protein
MSTSTTQTEASSTITTNTTPTITSTTETEAVPTSTRIYPCSPAYTGSNCATPVNGIDPALMQGLYLNALNNLNNVSSLKAIIEILQLKTDITECLLNCSNNGYCTYDASINSLVCSCFQNYTGSMCEIDKRPCNSARLQCANNGQCINNRIEPNKDDYNYTCNCSYPFYGDKCQFKINICQSRTCSNHGICQKVNDTIELKLMRINNIIQTVNFINTIAS